MEYLANDCLPSIASAVVHTPQQPFCADTPCACHEDETLIAAVAAFVQDGLLTSDEATAFVNGKTF